MINNSENIHSIFQKLAARSFRHSMQKKNFCKIQCSTTWPFRFSLPTKSSEKTKSEACQVNYTWLNNAITILLCQSFFFCSLVDSSQQGFCNQSSSIDIWICWVTSQNQLAQNKTKELNLNYVHKLGVLNVSFSAVCFYTALQNFA